MAGAASEVALLTGLPSLLARRVTLEVLASKDAFVHAIVPPKAEKDTQAFVEALPASFRSRIELHAGNAEAMDLGLAGKEYLDLAAAVTTVHHCPQLAYAGSERAALERACIGSAREMLELAKVATRLSCLLHYSTAAVSGSRTGLVFERELDADAKFRDPVVEARARAERRMRAAMGEHPIAVVRPGILVGDSATGEVDQFDGVYLLFLLIVAAPPDVAVPLPGDCDHPLHLVPVDFVGRAAAHIARQKDAPGKTFHLVDPAPLKARRIFEIVAKVSGHKPPRTAIPSHLAKALLRAPGLDRLVKTPSSVLDALVTSVRYDTSNTDAILRGTGIACPPFEGYAERLVSFVQARLRERRSRRPEGTPGAERPRFPADDLGAGVEAVLAEAGLADLVGPGPADAPVHDGREEGGPELQTWESGL